MIFGQGKVSEKSGNFISGLKVGTLSYCQVMQLINEMKCTKSVVVFCD